MLFKTYKTERLFLSTCDYSYWTDTEAKMITDY